MASDDDLAAEPVRNEPVVQPRAKISRPEPETGDNGLRLGLKVRHVKFGVGTVRRLEGQGDKQKVTVYFNSVGTKKLLLKFAGLIPV